MKRKAINYNGKIGTLHYTKNKSVAVMALHHLVCYLQIWSGKWCRSWVLHGGVFLGYDTISLHTLFLMFLWNVGNQLYCIHMHLLVLLY